MTTRRIDGILSGLGALLILISSYQLFFLPSGTTSGQKLGTLTSTLAVVKTKNALALDWQDATIGNDLTENQLIYTDNASSAEVSFNEGSSLEIKENSLVKLRAGDKEHAMDLSKGFIRARLEGDRPLKVQMNGEDYVVSGSNADIQINLENKRGEIGVIAGEIKVEKDGFSERLDSAVALEISGDRILKKNISLQVLSPKPDEISYILTTTASKVIEWSPKEEATVIISRKSSLGNPTKVSGMGQAEVMLGPGLYYFRIENEKGMSLLQTLKVIKEVPPQLIRPLNGDEVSILEESEQIVNLQWHNPDRSTYQLEWDDGEIHSLKSSLDRASIRINKVDLLRWRIKIDSPKRPEALWTQWQEVKVLFIPKPVVPTRLLPDAVEFQTYEPPQEKVELTWASDSQVLLEIKEPTGRIISEKPSGNSYLYLASFAGNYSWRVKAYDNFLRESEWSEWKNFSVEDLSSQKSDQGIQRFQLKKPDQTVTFSWQAEEGTVSVFELAKDAQFKTVVKKMEAQESVQVSIPEIGTYYWRSRRYLPDGTFEVGEPKRVIIEPVPAPSKPEKLPDLEVPLEELPAKTSLLERFLNFLIPSAHAQEEEGVIRLTLPVKEEAKQYVIRIYQDPELSQLVFEETLTSKEFVWRNAKAGSYYWQYAVVDFWDRQSLFSDPAVLTVKSEELPGPVKPRLRYPIRAVEIEQKDLNLEWTSAKDNTEYRVEISRDRNFKEIISHKIGPSSSVSFTDLKLTPELYFWRVQAFNKKGMKVVSNTGRFVIKPPLEKITVVDHGPWQKQWKKRAFLTWAPSMDSYTFKDGETGKIDGAAMMGIALGGSIFKEQWTFNGEFLRQSGEVYEGESYLFQRVLVDAVRTLNANPFHKLTIGFGIGHTSGQSYSIGAENSVSAESVSGPSYGPILKNYLVFNQSWEMQGRAMYLLGDIKQLEIGADLIRHQSSYLFTAGVGYSSREYEVNSGKQSSIKIAVGIGKEF